MGLHGVSEAAVTEPGVREELLHQQTLRLVRSPLGADGSGDTGGVTSSSSAGDDEMRQHRVECWSVWVSHLLSHLVYITYEIEDILKMRVSCQPKGPKDQVLPEC